MEGGQTAIWSHSLLMEGGQTAIWLLLVQTRIDHQLLIMNYYGVYGGQHFSPYYPSSVHYNMYPFYGQYLQSSQLHGFGVQYFQMAQLPLLPQNYSSTGIFSFPSSMAMPTTSATGAAATTTTATTTTIAASVAATSKASGQASGTNSEQNSTTQG